jgi:hypothetical protein
VTYIGEIMSAPSKPNDSPVSLARLPIIYALLDHPFKEIANPSSSLRLNQHQEPNRLQQLNH